MARPGGAAPSGKAMNASPPSRLHVTRAPSSRRRIASTEGGRNGRGGGGDGALGALGSANGAPRVARRCATQRRRRGSLLSTTGTQEAMKKDNDTSYANVRRLQRLLETSMKFRTGQGNDILYHLQLNSPCSEGGSTQHGGQAQNFGSRAVGQRATTLKNAREPRGSLCWVVTASPSAWARAKAKVWGT